MSNTTSIRTRTRKRNRVQLSKHMPCEVCARSGCGTKLSRFIVFLGNHHCSMNHHVSVLSNRCTLPLITRFTSSEKELHLIRRNQERGFNHTLIQNTCLTVLDYLVSAPFEQEAHACCSYFFQQIIFSTPKFERHPERLDQLKYVNLGKRIYDPFVLETDPLWELFLIIEPLCYESSSKGASKSRVLDLSSHPERLQTLAPTDKVSDLRRDQLPQNVIPLISPIWLVFLLEIHRSEQRIIRKFQLERMFRYEDTALAT